MNKNQVQTELDMHDFFGPVVSTYAREMAIEDGFLIDVTETAKEASIVLPTAVTKAVWDDYIEWTQDDQDQTYQDQSGRLWDVVWMARCAIVAARKGGEAETIYELYCIPRDGKSHRAKLTALKVHVGPGDDRTPVLTIMKLNES